jgi:hypothetical protein
LFSGEIRTGIDLLPLMKNVLMPLLLFSLLIGLILGATGVRQSRETVPSAEREETNPPSPVAARQLTYRGVSWVAGDSITEDQLEQLKQHHVNWIAQTPFGWQRHYRSPEVMLNTNGRAYWGELDQGLIHTTRLARQLGIKTLLKPHIWLRDRNDGKWLGDIDMETEEQWQRWFATYRAFILHYARLAQEHQMEALCIGTELHTPAVKREQDWRRLIREIRQVYGGQLTYAANWYKEYEEIKFWDELDFIGIQAYFPLTQRENPSVAELRKGWQDPLRSIEKVQQKYKKPVVFTEAGYKSTPDAAVEPWKWPDRNWQEIKVSEETQANGYEALFQTFWPKPYFEGLFIWKWYPSIREGRRDRFDFTPQHKAAAAVMSRWYQQAGVVE